MVALSSWAAAASPTESVGALSGSLFGLGLGWSITFVAASKVLAALDVGLQGRADGLGWLCAAVGSLASGFVLDFFGYTALCLLGLALALVVSGVLMGQGGRASRGQAAGEDAASEGVSGISG